MSYSNSSSRLKILMVDDDSFVREAVAQILSEHYQVFLASNGDEAVRMAEAANPAIILLDIAMPGSNGLEICRALRARSSTQFIPIIMLTAHDTPQQRTSAFTLGADDFIAKPFTADELLARINRKIERINILAIEHMHRGLAVGDIKLHMDSLTLEVEGRQIELSQIEYKLLNSLLKSQGQLVSRDFLNSQIWGDEIPSDRALDPHIHSIRNKLKKSQVVLKTVYGQGYSVVSRMK